MYISILIGFLGMILGCLLWLAKMIKEGSIVIGISIVFFFIALCMSPSNEGKSSNDGVYHYQDKDGNWNELDMNDYHQNSDGMWYYQK